MEKDRLINTVLGKCLLLKRIGRGGMGDVYLGHHSLLEKKVAIKVLPADFTRNPEFVERFHREAIAAAKLEHPNIVPVHDIGEENGCYFIAMSYIEGMTLQEILDANPGPMDAQVAIGIALGIARGLRCAHQQGIVHRDIKPANIMIADSGEVKLMDFGLAFETDAATQLTRAGAILGTPHFLSPEQADGRRGDARSDLYSLGVVLYYMATGVRPFVGESAMAVLFKHLKQAPEPPSKLNPKLSPRLCDLILRLLAKKPEMRPQTADDLIRELERAASSAARPAVPRNTIRASRPRRPLWIAGGALAFATLAIVLAAAVGGEGRDETPSSVSRDVHREAYLKGLQSEADGRLEEALVHFRRALQLRDAPEVRTAISRVETRVRKALEAEAWTAVLHARTPEAARGYLQRFPDGPHAAEAKALLEDLEFRIEPGFAPVFARWKDGVACHEHGRVEDGVLIVDASGDEPFHFLWLDRYDIADFTLRGEIWIERGRPGLIGRYLLKGAVDPARPNGLLWELDVPAREWVRFELSIEQNRAALAVQGRSHPVRTLGETHALRGTVGFSFEKGDRVKLRRVRLQVKRTV